jgi:hypothetical protein
MAVAIPFFCDNCVFITGLSIFPHLVSHVNYNLTSQSLIFSFLLALKKAYRTLLCAHFFSCYKQKSFQLTRYFILDLMPGVLLSGVCPKSSGYSQLK